MRQVSFPPVPHMPTWYFDPCFLFGHDYDNLLRDRDPRNIPVWVCPRCAQPVAPRSMRDSVTLDRPPVIQAH